MEANNTGAGGQPAALMSGVGVLREGRWILRGIDWSLANGQCAAILGPNASGKSTLARILACHLWPTEGSCTVLGETFGQANLPELRKRIRLVQAAGPYDIDEGLTALQVVLTGFFASLNLYSEPTEDQVERARWALETVGLLRVADLTYSRLSSGERVRSLLARALVTQPRLLLLDEATSGLDLLAREQVLATVQQLADAADAPAIVIITHHVEELAPATSNVLLLEDGRAAASGRPRDVLKSEVLSRVYRCPVEVRVADGRYYLQVHPSAWNQITTPPAPPRRTT